MRHGHLTHLRTAMNFKTFYYKRGNGDWVFQDGVFDELDGLNHLILKRRAGLEVCKLYLDKDFEEIKKHFFTPDYWNNKTWQQEYEQEF